MIRPKFFTIILYHIIVLCVQWHQNHMYSWDTSESEGKSPNSTAYRTCGSGFILRFHASRKKLATKYMSIHPLNIHILVGTYDIYELGCECLVAKSTYIFDVEASSSLNKAGMTQTGAPSRLVSGIHAGAEVALRDFLLPVTKVQLEHSIRGAVVHEEKEERDFSYSPPPPNTRRCFEKKNGKFFS